MFKDKYNNFALTVGMRNADGYSWDDLMLIVNGKRYPLTIITNNGATEIEEQYIVTEPEKSWSDYGKNGDWHVYYTFNQTEIDKLRSDNGLPVTIVREGKALYWFVGEECINADLDAFESADDTCQIMIRTNNLPAGTKKSVSMITTTAGIKVWLDKASEQSQTVNETTSETPDESPKIDVALIDEKRRLI